MAAYFINVRRATLNNRTVLRGPRETYSDVIVRLAQTWKPGVAHLMPRGRGLGVNRSGLRVVELETAFSTGPQSEFGNFALYGTPITAGNFAGSRSAK
jgi:hypothetical protein